ncbi:MAG: hypothetical protein HY822_17925, partial [Acidobacteria bacterium]|nr:hypothetical protein [Acidobacteriota bacterium]
MKDAVQAALERILVSPGFADAGRLGPFLRYVVEQALAGDGSRLKETVVGVEVFQRPADYDPRIDPIVRVEARRLRSRLAEYYEGPGADDAIRIDLPKGTYAPVFTARAAKPPAAKSRRRLLAAIGACALLTAVISSWPILSRRSAPITPSIAVLPFV